MLTTVLDHLWVAARGENYDKRHNRVGGLPDHMPKEWLDDIYKEWAKDTAKSKTYRRIKKKEREKLAKHLGEMDEDEVDEEVRMRREVNRAKERATLRHKNTGKWAKAMNSRGELDEDQRREINEMLNRGDKLRRRIHGQVSGSDDESEDEDEDHDSDMGGKDDLSKIKAHAFDELEQLNAEAGYDLTATPKGKSVFEMKLMRNAMTREQRKADQMAEDLIREMREDNAAVNGETINTRDASWQPAGGRVSFRPGNMVRFDPRCSPSLDSYPPLKAIQPRALPSFSMASDTSSVTLKSTDLLPDTPMEQGLTESPVVERSAANHAINPWLVTIILASKLWSSCHIHNYITTTYLQAVHKYTNLQPTIRHTQVFNMQIQTYTYTYMPNMGSYVLWSPSLEL